MKRGKKCGGQSKKTHQIETCVVCLFASLQKFFFLLNFILVFSEIIYFLLFDVLLLAHLVHLNSRHFLIYISLFCLVIIDIQYSANIQSLLPLQLKRWKHWL